MAVAHLIVDVSGHGYGHAAMTFPILNALRRIRPYLKLTIRTSVPSGWIAERLKGPFAYVHQPDLGMVMANALHVQSNESALAYAFLHKHWNERICDGAARLASLEPTLLLSNIPYLSIAAASKAGIPAIAMSSLNWADVFYHYCGHLPGAKAIWQQMVDAYAMAHTFLQLAPAMPMPSIHNGQAVGPVALLGRDRRVELRRRFGWDADKIIALLALGGTPTELPITHWPRLGRVRLVAASEFEFSHPDVRSSAEAKYPFIDLVRSSGVLVSKPGYGLVTESACNGVPIVLVSRPG